MRQYNKRERVHVRSFWQAAIDVLFIVLGLGLATNEVAAGVGSISLLHFLKAGCFIFLAVYRGVLPLLRRRPVSAPAEPIGNSLPPEA